MPMPANVPAWNTGGANRTEPSAGKKVLGWVVAEPVDSSFFNWWMFTAYSWILWLQGIQDESLTWTIQQQFTESITVKRTTPGNALSVTGEVLVTGTVAAGAGFYASGFGYGINSVTDLGSYFECTSASAPAIEIFKEGSAPGLIINADNEAAVVVAGSGSRYALNITGAGLGGAIFQGSGSNAVGARFLGATGIASPGYGATFLGGSPSIGAGKAGLYAVGGAQAEGGQFEGGSGTNGGYGITAVGSGISPAAKFSRADTSVVLPAIDCRGTVDLASAGVPAINANTLNKLGRNSTPKAWVRFAHNGTTSPTVISGINVAAVTFNTTTAVTSITFAASLGSDYGFTASCENLPGKWAIAFATARTASVLTLDHVRPSSSAYNAFVASTNAELSGTSWLVEVWGQ